jgi:hypothetical protein
MDEDWVCYREELCSGGMGAVERGRHAGWFGAEGSYVDGELAVDE